MEMSLSHVNLERPRYDQTTYVGRAKHFFITTNPLNLLATSTQLEEAKRIVEQHRNGKDAPGVTEDDLWRAKQLYDSAYHPCTKEKMFIFGRMSAQVPCRMIINGCMMAFYKSTPAVVFWQWFNQSFNTVVNYTNRSGNHSISVELMAASYVAATTSALVTALGLNRLAPRFPPVLGRFVPFAAIAAANCVNLPLMRSSEIMDGIPVLDSDGNRVGLSSAAAKVAIAQVVLSRIAMAAPGLWIPPLLMVRLERGRFLRAYPWMNAPVQIGLAGILLAFSTPMCCALFPQRSSIAVSSLERELREKLQSLPNPPQRVYFNKGL